MDTNTTDFTSLGNNIKIGNLTEDLTTFMEMVEEYMAFKVALQINFYWFPILAPIGLVGNTLSFLVMIQPNNKKISTCIYMAAISVNDNIMMCLALHNWLGSAKLIFEWHVVQCKTVTFLTALVKQNSRYQILAMTVDKYIAIKWPHRAAIYSTPKKAKLTLLGVLIFSLIYNTRHIFMSSLVGGKCRGYVHGGLIAEVLTWITFIVNGIIPISMLIYMNFVIIQTVKNSSKMFESTSQFKRESHTNMGMDKKQKKMKNVESQLTIMLLLVTILYLVLQIPTYIRNIYVKFVILNTPSKYVSSILSLMITYALFITSNGINFFLYCISGQKFRQDLKEMLCYDGKICKSCTNALKGENESQSHQVFTLSVSQNTQNLTIYSNQKGSIQ